MNGSARKTRSKFYVLHGQRAELYQYTFLLSLFVIKREGSNFVYIICSEELHHLNPLDVSMLSKKGKTDLELFLEENSASAINNLSKEDLASLQIFLTILLC